MLSANLFCAKANIRFVIRTPDTDVLRLNKYRLSRVFFNLSFSEEPLIALEKSNIERYIDLDIDYGDVIVRKHSIRNLIEMSGSYRLILWSDV